jgi:hypothetical protein
MPLKICISTDHCRAKEACMHDSDLMLQDAQSKRNADVEECI